MYTGGFEKQFNIRFKLNTSFHFVLVPCKCKALQDCVNNLSWSGLWQLQLPSTHQECWSVDAHTHTHTHYSDISWDVLNKHVSLYNLTIKHPIWWSVLVAWCDQNLKEPDWSSYRTFVDFGTLHGAWSFLLCLRWPEILAQSWANF